jgi:asparagine synthase (glutamine-hydrolysing)
MLYVDTKTWLPDDLLVKADKLTMANSLELRVPLLDHRVLEFAASLPSSYKLRGWSGKRILKAALRPRVPTAILKRPKAGFVMPIDRWLQGPLRTQVVDILTDRRTVQRGYFRPQVIERLLRGPWDHAVKELFSLLVLELWHRIFLDHAPVR